MKRSLLFVCFLAVTSSYAQYTAHFEYGTMPLDTFWNGQDSNGYLGGNMYFHSYYDTAFGGYWADGFAISTMRDSTDGSFMNLYSSRAATGHQSDGYAVVSAFDTTKVKNTAPGGNYIWTTMYINNTTYAHYSMSNGDAFAKKFGGASGNDPDYFFVRIKSDYGDSLDFYLADFRFTDNTEDYIISDWTEVELDLPGTELTFKLYSSDTNIAGTINTPAFFCIDDLGYSVIGAVEKTPATGFAQLRHTMNGVEVMAQGNCRLNLYSLMGQLLTSQAFTGSLNVNSQQLPAGACIVEVIRGKEHQLFKTILR